MLKPRAWWIILIAVIFVVAGVKPLRDQARVQWTMMSQLRSPPPSGFPPDPAQSSLTAHLLRPYRQRAVRFVEQHHPDDPEMLMAAGMLADDTSLLKRAAESGADPVAWSAYGEAVVRDAPSYSRLGNWGVDPNDAEAVAQAEREIAESGHPTKLSPDEAEPILAALRRWQQADADNALPVAIEVRYLYGLHRDEQCLSQWERAARIPAVHSHPTERARAVQRLLIRMGMPEPDAIGTSWWAVTLPSFSRLRDCARIALYEGLLAQMQGRPEDAIRWWNASIDIARHTQDSAQTMIGLLVGAAVHGIAGAPVWQWHHDERTGIPDGPLFNGRMFYGRQHDFYLDQVGGAADAKLRDGLVGAKIRSRLAREYTGGAGFFAQYLEANRLLASGLLVAAALLLILLLFVLTGTWRRRTADEATGLRPAWQIVLSVLVLLPVAVAVKMATQIPVEEAYDFPASQLRPLLGGVVLSLCAAALIPLAAAVFSRRPLARFRTAWRGNLRSLLAATLALGAVLYLGIGLTAVTMRARWVRDVTKPGVTEMSWITDQLGPEWHNPTIPPDSYRAQHPPEPPTE